MTASLSIFISIVGLALMPTTARFEDGLAAVRTVLMKQAEDWNAGNLDSFLEGYWRSPQLVFQSGGTRTLGFDAVRERYVKLYKSGGREMGKLVFDELELQPLGEEYVSVIGRWQVTRVDQTKVAGRFTLLVRKFAEGWRIVLDHTSSAP